MFWIKLQYATLLMVLLVVEIGIAVTIYTNRDEVKDLFETELKKSISEYNTTPEVKEVWDTMQSNVSNWIYAEYLLLGQFFLIYTIL